MPYIKRFRLFDQAGEGGGEGGGQGSQQTQQTKPETFSREYVQELRHESASYRTKAAEAEKKAQEAADAAKKAQDEADAKTKEAETKANERIIRAELKAEAIKAGMVDLDGLKLADLSTVKLNEAGEVEGAAELMEALKKSKPFLFGSTSSTSNTGKPPEKKEDTPKKATEMDDKEWAEQRKKFGLRK